LTQFKRRFDLRLGLALLLLLGVPAELKARPSSQSNLPLMIEDGPSVRGESGISVPIGPASFNAGTEKLLIVR
jgi:hypothetical protein